MDWNCPHCGSLQTVTDKAWSSAESHLTVGKFAEAKAEKPILGTRTVAIRCANSACQKVTVTVHLFTTVYNNRYEMVPGSTFYTAQIYPGRVGKAFPSSVPTAMLNDYYEAWSIIDLSPKSSATLARRCLQAMIRDFCGIRKNNLFKEIACLEQQLTEDTLPKGVEPETVAAMKALKDVGNIGAHMTDIDGVIADVDQGEAEALLGLIEMLFSDWYVARAKRRERLAAIEAIAATKSGI